MIKTEEVYKIGKLGKPHGVKGEITFMFDDDVFDRTECDCLVLSVDGIFVPFFIEEYRFRGSGSALMKFEGIDTQEKAAGLTNTEVYFLRRLSDGEPDELSWAAIVGYTVTDGDSGRVVGRIAAVDDSTVNTLFELEDGTLIPVQDELIGGVDNDSRNITMTLPDGLLDMNRAG